MNYKSLSKKELRSWFKDIIKFTPEPFKHQYASVAFTLGESLKRVFLIHGIGTGKTLTALFLVQSWNPKKTLIICPNSVIRTWEKELTRQPSVDFIALTGTKLQREKKFALERDFYIINYEGLRTICCTRTKRGRRMRNILDRTKINKLGFDAIIIDESHHLRNRTTIQSRICEGLTKRARYVILMTGTPIGRDIKDLFSQMLVLDNGKTFGRIYHQFKRFYFFKERFRKGWTEKRVCGLCNELYENKVIHITKVHKMSWWKYKLLHPVEKTARDLILDTVGESAMRYSREECVDLPSLTYEVREVDPSPSQVRSTIEVVAGLDLNIIQKNIKYHMHKVIQITSGFLFDKEKVVHTFSPNPKLAELQSLIDEIDGKFIIYHNYNYEAEMIAKALDKKHIKWAMLNGTIKDKGAELDKFIGNKDCRALIAHPKSGGEGLDGLQDVSRIIIFYSNGFIGNILREQAEGRIHRTGQKKPCVIIDLIMKGTIDEIMYHSLKKQEAVNAKILLYLQEMQKKP